MPSDDEEARSNLSPSQLKPYFSITVLECVIDDAESAFGELIGYLRQAAHDKGRALAVEVVGEIDLKEPGVSTETDPGQTPTTSSLERIFAVVRKRATVPGWATRDSGFVDTIYQLSLALSRGRLAAVRTDMISSNALLKWADRVTSPYKPLLPEILQGTFDGDGTMVWLQGVHRQRASMPNNKALGGVRLQESYDAIADASFALTSMRIKYIPKEADSALHGQLTVSADRSHLSAKAMQDLSMFVAATDEALAMLEKAVTAEHPPTPTMPGYAMREHDLGRVLARPRQDHLR